MSSLQGGAMFYLFRGRVWCTLGFCAYFFGIHILELYLFIICHFFPHGAHNMFVKCFQERQVWSQPKQSILVHAMISQDWLFLNRLVCLNMGSFIVFRLIMYWAYFCTWDFVMDLQRGRLLSSCVLVLSNHAKLCIFYWVLMCLKVIIEDQVEDTKFAQEKHIFSINLDSSSIKARNILSPW